MLALDTILIIIPFIGDPHPGNVLVRKHPLKKNQVEVVLIDHGLYIQESEK